MPGARAIAMLGLALALGLVALPARAQDLADLPPLTGSVEGLRAGTEQQRPYWRGSGPDRIFFAANFDVGVPYFRPVAQVGYGRPHYRWFGAETYVSPGIRGGRGFIGLRALMPGLAGRVGVRYELPFGQDFVAPRESYDREDLQLRGLGPSRYLAAEAELIGSLPIPTGEIFGVLTGNYLANVPDGLFVFEEAFKVVAKPPWLWRARAGYLYHLGWMGSMKLGAAVETIHLASREELVVRAGPLLSVALTHHLEANGAIMIVAYSPDSLGLLGADIGQIGLRYRWATGDRWAEFP